MPDYVHLCKSNASSALIGITTPLLRGLPAFGAVSCHASRTRICRMNEHRKRWPSHCERQKRKIGTHSEEMSRLSLPSLSAEDALGQATLTDLMENEAYILVPHGHLRRLRRGKGCQTGNVYFNPDMFAHFFHEPKDAVNVCSALLTHPCHTCQVYASGTVPLNLSTLRLCSDSTHSLCGPHHHLRPCRGH